MKALPPLKTRRRAARRRTLILLLLLLVALLGAAFYGIWRPAVRIQHIEASGADAQSLPAIATQALGGRTGGIFPRDSIFFFPKDSLRAAILDANPDIAAVSISRIGFDSIELDAIPRVSAFSWCGTSIASSTPGAPCYQSDSEGFIFAPIAVPTDVSASTTGAQLLPPGTLAVYAPLTGDSADTPLRSSVADASAIPDVLRFERAMETLGAQVSSIQLRGDEADLFLKSGTRITYVLGHESEAAELAATAFPSLNLNDGSVDYVDLRFDGKVYYKKEGGQ